MDIASKNQIEVISCKYARKDIVFWIDSIWNVGIGKHEDNVMPYDLAGHGTYESGSCEFGKDFLLVRAYETGPVYKLDDVVRMFPSNTTGSGTLEVVYEATYASDASYFAGDVCLGEAFAYLATQQMHVNAHKYNTGISRASYSMATGTHVCTTSAHFTDNHVDTLHVNGVQQSLTGIGYAINGAVTPYVKIGFQKDGVVAAPKYDRKFFAVRLYDRKLTEDEIMQNAATDKERFEK